MKKVMLSILLMCIAGSLNAETLGRLFSRPNEREALDYVRKTKKEIVPQKPMILPEEMVVESEPVELPDSVAVQGYVKRSDGKKNTVWVNGEALQETGSNADLKIGKLPQNGNRVPVKLKGNGKVLGLKAGQAYYPDSNKVKEIHQSGNGVSNLRSDESAP
jgi:hypothetical protein